MSDSDTSTVDPNDSDASTVDPNDSDASIVDPDDFDATEELDTNDIQRAMNSSPDLFADYPEVTKTISSKESKSYDRSSSSTEKSLLKPNSFSKKETLVKRRSNVHELSDSGSDTDQDKSNNKLASANSAEVRNKVKIANGDSIHKKAYKRDYSQAFNSNKQYKRDHSQAFDSKSTTTHSEKEKIDKQKFLSDFLSMSDDDLDVVRHKKVKTSSDSKDRKEFKGYDKKDKEICKDKQLKHQTNADNSISKKTLHSEKVKHYKSETHVMTEDKVNKEFIKHSKKEKEISKEKQHNLQTHPGDASRTSKTNLNGEKCKPSESEKYATKADSVSMKRKSSSSSPHLLKKSDTVLLSTSKGKVEKGQKPVCKYGSKCYRKNPSHREEFSHPVADNEEPSTSSARDTPPAKKVKVSPSVSSRPRSPPRARSPPRTPKTIRDKFSQAQPYSFFLTRVSGIADKFNSSFVMDIKDILSAEMGNLTASCQFNYMFDVEWLMKQYPSQFRSKPLLLVHGEQGPSKAALQAQAINYSNIRFCQAKLEMMFGTHHTKMMLLLYDCGLRVVIHTSNLIQQDWFQKTQGIWISPVFPKLPTPSKDKGDSVTYFKRDLIEYLSAYKAYQLQEWIEHLASHDMSTARVVVIGSVPGRHTVDKNKWGHLKLRKVLKEHGPDPAAVKSWPVIGQFSSIGSMGASKDQWLCREWLESLSATKSSTGFNINTRLQLVFPSKDNVRLSLEGFPAGGSIPYSVKTAKKQTWLHDFFHVWGAECRGRSRAMPHIKTFLRPAQDGKKTAWFLVTSANLSKAAWGAFEKKGTQLMIRSYEIGVLYLPKFFGKTEVFHIAEDIDDARSSDHILLPYDLPPTAYKKGDRPWMWDIPYMDLPDTNGNIWCPFSK